MEENDVKSTFGATRLEFRIERVEDNTVQKLRHCIFSIQNLTRNEFFSAKSCIQKKQEKWELYRFYGVKWTKTWFLNANNFSKSDISKKNYFKIQRLVELSNQNQTRSANFVSKPDVLCFFYFKIWRVVKFFIHYLLFKWYFQILAESLSKCYQQQRTTCWKMTTTWSKNVFTGVWHVFVSRLLLYF